MDPKVIEMNNLRVLNDYLNQTIEVLVRGPRLGNGHSPFGYSPFGTIPSTPATMGTDVVYGPSPYTFGSQMFGHTPFTPPGLFGGLPMGSYGTVDPFLAQRALSPSAFGAAQPWGQPTWGQPTWGQPAWGQQPWGAQTAWSPISEVTRQAHVTQALAAKQSVLEAICRCAGIAV